MWAKQREYIRRTELVRELTNAGGGRLLETTATERLREMFLEILSEMKTRYLLS